MARELIDRGKLYDKVAFGTDLCDPCRDEMINLLDEQPAVDAVPVVRCKDCKYYNQLEKGCDWHGYYYHVRVEPEDFCSYGERRTDV